MENTHNVSVEGNQADRHKKQLWIWAIATIIALLAMIMFYTSYITHTTKIYSQEAILGVWCIAVFCTFFVQCMKHWTMFNWYRERM